MGGASLRAERLGFFWRLRLMEEEGEEKERGGGEGKSEGGEREGIRREVGMIGE